MFIAALDFITILPFAIFVAIGIGCWVVVDNLLNKKTRTDVRLEELRKRTKGEPTESNSAGDNIKQMLEKASPSLSKPFTPKNEKEMGKLKARLVHAGFRGEQSWVLFLTLKTIFLLTGLVLGGGTILLLTGFSSSALLKAAMVAAIFFFVPDIVLAFLGKKRKEKIFLGLPDALDLLVVCVEAGLGLDQAMRKVAEEMVKSNPIIAFEFAQCNMELQLGGKREDVLTELGYRSGVDDLKALASIIIQADKFGSSIARALRVQSDSMRVKRKQLAEEKAAKTAVKLIFPLVLFIFPGIFVVLVGPAAITMINEMLPAFQK